jgi:hypothetical protein
MRSNANFIKNEAVDLFSVHEKKAGRKLKKLCSPARVQSNLPKFVLVFLIVL